MSNFAAQMNQGFLDDLDAARRTFTGPPNEFHQKYTTSNDFPSQDDINFLEKGMQAVNTQSNLVESQISSLQTTLLALQEEQKRLDSISRQYHKLLRSIRSLPLEILSKIFMLCIEDSDSLSLQDEHGGRLTPPERKISTYPRRMPWVLAQVCHSWRNISLETHGLWTYVSIEALTDGFPGLTASEKVQGRAARNHRLGLQLRRSGDRTFRVFVSGHAEESAIGEEEAHLQILSIYAQRWRSLRIEIDGILPPEISYIRGSLSSLEDLHLVFSDGDGSMSPELDWFELAPKLTKLTLSGGYASRINTEDLRLPFAQVLDYTWFDWQKSFGRDGWSYQSKILRSMPNLSRYRVVLYPKSIKMVTLYASESLNVTLPELAELELYNHEEADLESAPLAGVQQMLRLLITPSLTHLTVFASGPELGGLYDFITKHTTITSLTIHKVEMPPTYFRIVLTKAVCLTRLSIGGFTNDHLKVLIPTAANGDGMYVPKLTELVLLLSSDTVPSYMDQTLQDIIQARSSGYLDLIQIERRTPMRRPHPETNKMTFYIFEPGRLEDVYRKVKTGVRE